MRRLARTLGTLLIVCGLGTLGWAVVVWRWQDPFTGVYTRYEQHQLSDRYHRSFVRYRAIKIDARRPPARPVKPRRASDPPPTRISDPPPRTSVATEQRLVSREATRYRKTLGEGDPLGRLRIPRLGLNIITVNGTEDASLRKGPGRYAGPHSFVPGEGQLVYIAGHRTTYLAPFSHIDRLRAGDHVTLELPYATFDYVVYRHIIVPADDLAVLRSHGREVLALQACHPRFFATHRYIAYARLVRVVPRQGAPYMASRSLAAAA